MNEYNIESTALTVNYNVLGGS